VGRKMTRVSSDHASVFLMPGFLYCAPVATRVTTILGSCVAVCLWDKVRRLGGMNHYLLPHQRPKASGPRFGDVAIAQLVDGMVQLGCRPASMYAKVFGGATVLPFDVAGTPIGQRNIDVAVRELDELEIPIIAYQTGGYQGLWICLHTETGEVLARGISTTLNKWATAPSRLSPGSRGAALRLP